MTREGSFLERLETAPARYLPDLTPEELGHEAVRIDLTRPMPEILAELARRNRRLPAYKRLEGALLVDDSFPRTTSLKLKRRELARILSGRSREEPRRL